MDLTKPEEEFILELPEKYQNSIHDQFPPENIKKCDGIYVQKGHIIGIFLYFLDFITLDA